MAPKACGTASASCVMTPSGSEAAGPSSEGCSSLASPYTPASHLFSGRGALTPSSDDSCSVASAGSHVDVMPASYSSNTSELSSTEPSMSKLWSNSTCASTRCSVESEAGASCPARSPTAAKPERASKMEKMIVWHVQTQAFAPDPDDVLLSMAAAERQVSKRPVLLGATSQGDLSLSQDDQKSRRVSFSSAPPEVLMVDYHLVAQSLADLADFSNPRHIDKELLNREV